MANIIQTEDGFVAQVDPIALTSRSKYFKALFLYNKQSCILIRGVSGDTIKQILDYFDEGNLVLSESNFFPLLEAADYLLLDGLVEDISRFLLKLITPSNCVDFLIEASNLNHLNTSKLCYGYVQTHFESVLECSDIGSMSLEPLRRLLTDADLCVDSEEVVWNAVVKWVEKDAKERLRHVSSLLNCVRLEVCSEQCVSKIISHPFVSSNEFCESFGLKRNFFEINLKEYLVETIKKVSPEIYLGARVSNLTVLVSYDKFDRRGNEIFNLSITSRDGVTIKIAEKENVYPQLISNHNEKIYIFGYPLLAFDLLSQTWLQLPIPESCNVWEECYFFKISDRIYVVWMDGDSESVKISLFDLDLRQWHDGRSFPCPDVLYFTATVHDDLIYTAFYVTDSGLMGKRYDPLKDMWSDYVLPEIYNPYSDSITMVSFEGVLLLTHDQSSVVYQLHPDKNVWEVFQELPDIYEFPELEVRHGMLFVHGLPRDSDFETVYWDKERLRWHAGSELYDSPDSVVVENEAVVRHYHKKLMEKKWQTLVEEWS